MKLNRFHTRLPEIILSLAFATVAQAQFDSGSTGAYGPMNITANTTLPLPEDGIFHCTTINIAASTTLKFTRNSRNTPVYLLATGNVTINGTIDVSGSDGSNSLSSAAEGGPGGYDGGRRSTTGSTQGGGDGMGPGGGMRGTALSSSSSSSDINVVGHASYRNVSPASRPRNGAIYGNSLLIPLVGGSGGGGTPFHSNGFSMGGGGGGGAILISSLTQISFGNGGRIDAHGGRGAGSNSSIEAGSGSGGAIRIVAPAFYTSGGGNFYVYGGTSAVSSQAGAGRVRIDAISKSGISSTSTIPSGNVSIGANMIVFPPDLPELRITEAAGQAIDPQSAAPVTLLLPAGSATTQVVKVQARNFRSTASVRVVLTPENGDKLTYDLDIPNPTDEPTERTVNVEFPPTQLTRVDVWTR